MKQAIALAYTLAIVLAVALITPSIGHAQLAAGPHDVGGFIHSLVGEWIGICEQSTDGKQADNKYFHAVIKQSSPGSYQTALEYYRVDDQTGGPVEVGQSTMTTTVAPDGTAKNDITGQGQVMIDPTTSKPEQHDLSEVLRISPSGGLQGSGSGSISVSGMALGAGKNGKVDNYSSSWTMQDGTLKISQDLKVSFRVLFFSKKFAITAQFTGNRGSDIGALMKSAQSKGASHPVV
jgi:hypothetical protein